MIRYIEIAGESHPADFSILTLAQLARKYDVDITGLAEVAAGGGHLDEQIQFIAEVGTAALNAGAKREGKDKRFTGYDVIDAMTVDLSLIEAILTAFKEAFEGSVVFQKPSQTAKKGKK